MNNPFKAGDKVLTKVKGQPVEALVNQVWNDEVQVRTADKALLWRTVRTVTLTSAAVPPVTEPVKPVATTPVTPLANVDGGGAKPPPRPPVKYAQPSEKKPRSGPALMPVKYKRTRSRRIKRGKI